MNRKSIAWMKTVGIFILVITGFIIIQIGLVTICALAGVPEGLTQAVAPVLSTIAGVAVGVITMMYCIDKFNI